MLNDSRLVRPAAVAATLLLASSLVALPACSQTSTTTSSFDAQSTSAASDAQSVTVTDDLGREVTVSNPQRVVACMGSFAGAWQLAGGTLVGASDDAFAHYVVDSATVAGVGKSTALNLESILDLDPDFVIMTGISDGKHATGVSQEEWRRPSAKPASLSPSSRSRHLQTMSASRGSSARSRAGTISTSSMSLP